MPSSLRVVDVILLLELAVAIVLLLRMRRLKARQDELVAAVSGHPFWRVAIARPAHAQRFWKLSPVQALGVLIDEGRHVRLRARWNASGEALEVVLPKDAAHHPTWIGRLSLRAGAHAWARIPGPDGDLLITPGSGLQPLASREGLADLLRSAFPSLQLPVTAARDFALEKNPSSLVAIGVMFTLFLFGLLDTYVFNDFELIDAQIHALARQPMPLVLAAGLMLGVGGGSGLALRWGRVPAMESLGLALLLAAAAAVAAVPALKRVDRLLAPASQDSHRYRVADRKVTLLPVDTSLDLPTLRFRRAPEYWAQFDIGTEVAVPLVRGGLGLWQLDHGRFDAPIIAFYDRRSPPSAAPTAPTASVAPAAPAALRGDRGRPPSSPH